MKSNPKLFAAVALALALVAQSSALAQKQKKDAQTPSVPKPVSNERLEPDDKTAVRTDVPESAQQDRREGMNEEAEGAIPYSNNYLSTYRLGPEDVISISVFGLDKYSKSGITVPPDGRIDYYLVRGGIHVAGKTTEQVADEIARHLDEYIIEPKVTVSVDKPMSARYGVVGDVAQPGIRIMTRRVSLYEALNEAGGILPTGKKQVVVLHWNVDRVVERFTVDVAKIERGEIPDNYFLRPGDQVFVPGNRYKTVKKVLEALPVINFMRIFTGGF